MSVASAAAKGVSLDVDVPPELLAMWTPRLDMSMSWLHSLVVSVCSESTPAENESRHLFISSWIKCREEHFKKKEEKAIIDASYAVYIWALKVARGTLFLIDSESTHLVEKTIAVLISEGLVDPRFVRAFYYALFTTMRNLKDSGSNHNNNKTAETEVSKLRAKVASLTDKVSVLEDICTAHSELIEVLTLRCNQLEASATSASEHIKDSRRFEGREKRARTERERDERP